MENEPNFMQPEPQAQPATQPQFAAQPAMQAAAQVPPQQYAPQGAPYGYGQAPKYAEQAIPAAAYAAQPSNAQPGQFNVGQAGVQGAPYSAPAYAPAPEPAPAYASPAPAAVAPAQKSHGWIVAIVLIVALTALMAFSVHSCTSMFSGFSDLMNGYGASSVETTGATIAIIEIDGTIQYDGTACSPEGLKELLDEAESDDNIKAVVLRVNSGGGTATAGEEMAEYVRQFSKPIVVSSASVNASAAYEISSQADYIFVAKSTEIGSIGTAFELMDLSGLFEKLGISMDTITSSENKDSTYGYRALTDEERAFYQDMVNQVNDVFIQNVAAGRNMKESDVRALANGFAYTGMDSVKNGLADEIGTREDAIEKAAELAGITGDYDVYTLTFSYSSIYNIYDMFSKADPEMSVSDLLETMKGQPNGVRIR